MGFGILKQEEIVKKLSPGTVVGVSNNRLYWRPGKFVCVKGGLIVVSRTGEEGVVLERYRYCIVGMFAECEGGKFIRIDDDKDADYGECVRRAQISKNHGDIEMSVYSSRYRVVD